MILCRFSTLCCANPATIMSVLHANFSLYSIKRVPCNKMILDLLQLKATMKPFKDKPPSRWSPPSQGSTPSSGSRGPAAAPSRSSARRGPAPPPPDYPPGTPTRAAVQPGPVAQPRPVAPPRPVAQDHPGAPARQPHMPRGPGRISVEIF